MKSDGKLIGTICVALLTTVVLASVAGCGLGKTKGQQGNTGILPVAVEEPEGGVALTFHGDGTFAFSNDNRFFTDTVKVLMAAPAGSRVFYTLDGSEPDKTDLEYKGGFTFDPVAGEFPDAYVLRAKALFSDGTWSKTAAGTYFVAEKVKERYSTLVFSISGEPEELTEMPDGIFAGNNFEERGKDSERKVYIEMINPDGTGEISQFGGIRIFGGYSRENSIKSMKLFSRASYDADHKNFKLSNFGTPKLDGSDRIITKYDKLVLRNAGNDFQYCFLRDELSQTLCKNAGFEVYEAVLPAVAYLNGKYYGLFWLHENYCDKYFKEKFGNDAKGEFVILEGSEQEKDHDNDELTEKYVKEYNSKYKEFAERDMTDDGNFEALWQFLDVENYLNYFAWNIVLNNGDWPNNNYKCYRYVPVEDDTKSESVFDGRWRFLPHDMDFSYGIYGMDKALPDFDTLGIVTDPSNERYAPLFAQLMKRKDCRDYFYDKSIEYITGVLSEMGIKMTYWELDDSRKAELYMFYKYISQLMQKGDTSLWCTEDFYPVAESFILAFAEHRQEHLIRQMDSYFGTFGDKPRGGN